MTTLFQLCPILILGASLSLSSPVQAVLLGLLGWLPLHHLLRDWLYWRRGLAPC